jgi:cytochrome c biogenesis protein CcdA
MKNFLKWGIYITALNIVFMLVGYFIGWTTTPLGRTMGYVSMAAGLILLFMGIRERKMQDPGDFTFGRGWVEGTLISLVAAVFFAIFFYLFAAFINPEMIDYARSEAAKNMASMPKEQVEQAKKMVDFMISPAGYAIGTVLMYTIGGMIMSLIFAPIIKGMGGNSASAETV